MDTNVIIEAHRTQTWRALAAGTAHRRWTIASRRHRRSGNWFSRSEEKGVNAWAGTRRAWRRHRRGSSPIWRGATGLRFDRWGAVVYAGAGVNDLDVVVFEPERAPTTESMLQSREVPKMTSGPAARVELMNRYLNGLLPMRRRASSLRGTGWNDLPPTACRVGGAPVLYWLASEKQGLVAMAGTAQHVVPRDGRWAVRKGGAERVTRRYDTQREAVDAAREIARKHRTEVFVHGRDGRIRERNSYGNDPFPPEG